MNNTNIYCTAPWNGITVREDGHVRTCCSGKISLGDLNQESINDIIQNDQILNIQKKMLNGQPDVENCQSCVSRTSNSGLAPLRNHYLQYYPDISHGNLKLNSLDIRWNNTCNLSCMYCSPMFSSTWADKLNVNNASPVKSYQDDLLEFILSKINDVKEITLVGGEPMLMKQNYRLFKHLPNNTKISIITNLSYDLENLPCINDLLTRPQDNILWNVSAENINKQFEYVRNGATWDQFEKNIKFLAKHWGNQTTILMVYSMFSAFELSDVIEKFHSLGIKKFMLQSYTGNPCIDVFKMPKDIQKLAAIELGKAKEIHYKNIHIEDHQLYSIDHADSLINHLVKETDPIIVSKEEFINRIAWYDQWNNQKFQDLWPHVLEMVIKRLA